MLEEILIPAGTRSRPLHPQLQAQVEQRSLQPASYEIPVAEARRRFLNARKAPAEGYADGIATEDRTIQGEGGAIPIRIYRPEAATADLPILIYFHGGGFVLGNLDSHDLVCRSFCKGAGVLVLSVDYRLSPEHAYPAAVDDGWSALRFAAEAGATIGGDPARIALAGDSAGGMLALATALRARDAGGPAIRAMAPFYPMADLVGIGANASYQAFGDGSAGLSTRDVEWFVGCYCPSERRSEAYASPVLATSVAGLPPSFIVLAEKDVLYAEGREFSRRLAEAGVPTTRVDVSGVNHGFMGTDIGLVEVEEAFALVNAWLQEKLAA